MSTFTLPAGWSACTTFDVRLRTRHDTFVNAPDAQPMLSIEIDEAGRWSAFLWKRDGAGATIVDRSIGHESIETAYTACVRWMRTEVLAYKGYEIRAAIGPCAGQRHGGVVTIFNRSTGSSYGFVEPDPANTREKALENA